MNLTRQMQSIADLYSSVKQIKEKTYTSTQPSKTHSSISDKNSNMLNELYTNIYNNTTKKERLNESATESGMDPESRVRSDEPSPFGYGNGDTADAREKIILNAVTTVANTKESDDNVNDLVASVNMYIKDKTGKTLNTAETSMVFDSLKRLTKQEDEIDVVKSDLNKDGKLSEYEGKRGAAIDKAMGGSGEHVSEAMKAMLRKKNRKHTNNKKQLPGIRKEKFDYLGGKTKHLMNGTNFKFKPGKSKNTLKPFNSVKSPVTKVPFIANSGPNSDGVKLPQKPLEPSKQRGAKDDLYNVNKFSQGVKKIDERNINNDMSKSTFDKLFEDVMADDDAIALGATDTALDINVGDAGNESMDDNGDVTITLPRDVAVHLHSILADILGDADDGTDDSADDEMGEMGEEDEMHYGQEDAENCGNKAMGEEIEAEDLGHPLVNQKRGDATSVKGKSNVVDSTVSKLAKAGKGGDGSVTDKVGNDGDLGHPLVNQTKGTELSNVKGKSNVVKSTTSSKVGDNYFQST